MSSSIAFLITRSSELRSYAPVIVHARRLGIPVYLLCGPNPEATWHHVPAYRMIPENMRFPGEAHVPILPFSTYETAAASLTKKSVSDLITVHPVQAMLEPFKQRGIRVRFMQYAADYLPFTPELWPHIDTFFFYSPKMVDVYNQAYPHFEPRRQAHKIKCVGNPILDGLNDIDSDPERIRHRHHLPPKQKIVLFFSTGLNTSFWRWRIFGAAHPAAAVYHSLRQRNFTYWRDIGRTATFKDIVQAIQEWAHRQNAVLLIKSRFKHEEPSYVRRAADYMLTDSTVWYPHSSLELLRVAAVNFNLNSNAALEAAAAGTPNVSINVTQDFDHQKPHIHFWKSGFFDFPGVSFWPNYRQTAEFLDQHTIPDLTVDPAQRQQYMKTYVGFDDYHASDRLLKHLIP